MPQLSPKANHPTIHLTDIKCSSGFVRIYSIVSMAIVVCVKSFEVMNMRK